MAKRHQRPQTIRRMKGTWLIDGRFYPQICLVEIGSAGDNAIRALSEDDPRSVRILEDTDIQGWRSFLPRQCSPSNPQRFLDRATLLSGVPFRVEDFKPAAVRERLVRHVRDQQPRRYIPVRSH